MLRNLVQSWWLLHLRGILAVGFGAFLLFLAGTMQGMFNTTIAMLGVLLIFICYLLVSGVLSLVAAFRWFSARERFWAAVVHGTVMLALGLWLFFSNQVTVMWLVWFTVANAFGSGLLEIMLARALRRHIDSIMLTLAGAVSLAISVLLIVARNAQLSGLVSTLGVYAIFYGAVLIVFSLRLHDHRRSLHLAHSK